MTLDASGNLGVGETAPSGYGKFIVSGTGNQICLNATSGVARINFYEGANNRFGFLTLNNGASGIAFVDTSTATERARIDSSGNLLVGTTTALAKLTAFASSGDIFSAKTSGTSTGFVYSSDSTTTSDAMFFIKDSAGVGSIQCTSVATVYNTTSDYRLKTVIGPVANAGQRIDALQPVEYTWNSNGLRTRGFLAHQFQEVYAGSVSGTKDAVDEEGKPVYQAMQASTSEVIADLVAEIQSLRARLAAANI
jgi:hypothetical protein